MNIKVTAFTVKEKTINNNVTVGFSKLNKLIKNIQGRSYIYEKTQVRTHFGTKIWEDSITILMDVQNVCVGPILISINPI